MSIAAFAVAAARDRLDRRVRSPGPRSPRVAGAAVFALNPNVLYLQATPMTEPLLLAHDDGGGGDADGVVERRGPRPSC